MQQTNTNIFDKFNAKFGGKDLAKQVKEQESAPKEKKEFEEVPYGTYEVKIEKMEIKPNKNDVPMFTCWFKVVQGKQKNGMIFMNQNIEQAFQIHIVDEFLRSLGTSYDVEFNGDYADYNDMILDIHEEIKRDKLEFLLDYNVNSKGFNTFKIEEVYEA